MKLAPAVFWALSLVEWRAMLKPLCAPPGLGRGDLERLMKEYPD